MRSPGFEPGIAGLEGLILTADAKDKVVSEFKEFCEVDLQLSELTVNGHVRQIKRLFKNVQRFTREDIRGFLMKFKDKSPNTYANVLKSLRVFFRDFQRRPDLVQSFRFPHREPSVKVIPSRSEVQQFYNALESIRDKALFLMYASTGLRASEVSSLKLSEVNFQKRMVKPEHNKSRTKRTWISFFNCEAAKLLKQYLANRDDDNERVFPISRRRIEKIFNNASKISKIYITPQTLREWFSEEMSRLGVNDRYIDAFCGRIPKSVLAKHYSDYSPEKLKEIYNKAGLKVLE